MPIINAEKLKDKIKRGVVSVDDLRKALARELNNQSILTLPPIGVDNATREANAKARKELDVYEADASHNIPILTAELIGLNESIELPKCRSCEKYFAGHGNVCSMCYEPEEF